MYCHGGIVMYFVDYVDDIILTGNLTACLQSFSRALSSQFSLKELGDLHYFLGMKVIRSKDGTLLL